MSELRLPISNKAIKECQSSWRNFIVSVRWFPIQSANVPVRHTCTNEPRFIAVAA